MRVQNILAIAAAVGACAIVTASLSYAVSQYIRVKEHNLDVIAQMRLCFDPDLIDENVVRCAELAREQWVGYYPESEE